MIHLMFYLIYSNTNDQCGFQYWFYNSHISVELYTMYSDMCVYHYYYIDVQKESNKIKSL